MSVSGERTIAELAASPEAIAARSHQPRWHMVAYITTTHVFALMGAVCCFWAKWQTLVLALVLYVIGAVGITAGCHRLWSHRSYKAKLPFRTCLMLATAVANQGSIFHWARDHRLHHKHSDTEADPHNALRGIFYSHLGWLLVKKHPLVRAAGKEIPVDDLLADPLVRFQLKCDPWFNFFICFVAPTLVASHFWGESAFTAFTVAGAFRYIFTLHCTWMVNSAAHFFGCRPYDPKMKPAENIFVTIFAFGEGWHNWHHKFPYDYSASEYGASRQFNPTRVLIDFMACCGQVSDRKRATDIWEAQKRRMALRAGESAPDQQTVSTAFGG